MSKENTYLKYALGFITILLVVVGISLVISTVLSILGIMHLDLFHQGDVNLGIDLVDGDSAILMVVSLISSYIIWFILYCVRLFFRNIIEDKIFVEENVKLAKRTSLLLVITAFLTNGLFTINNYSFFNVNYIVTALVVWILSVILSKANQIAEENEFTV